MQLNVPELVSARPSKGGAVRALMRHAELPRSAKASVNARPMGSGAKPDDTRTAQQVMSAFNKGIALPRTASASSPSISIHE